VPHKRKGHLTTFRTENPRKHLQKEEKKEYWSRERLAEKEFIKKELHEIESFSDSNIYVDNGSDILKWYEENYKPETISKVKSEKRKIPDEFPKPERSNIPKPKAKVKSEIPWKRAWTERPYYSIRIIFENQYKEILKNKKYRQLEKTGLIPDDFKVFYSDNISLKWYYWLKDFSSFDIIQQLTKEKIKLLPHNEQFGLIRILYLFTSLLIIIARCNRRSVEWLLENIQWHEKLFSWVPDKRSFHKLLKSLVYNVIIIYPIPEFLLSIFYMTHPLNNKSARSTHMFCLELFKEAGNGGSIFKYIKRNGYFEVPFTKKMCFYFINAPSDLTIIEAFRYAQLRVNGGGHRLINAVLQSPLGSIVQDNERYWLSVMILFCKSPMLDPYIVLPLINYLRIMKAENLEYSIKRRSVVQLITQMNEWYSEKNKKEYAEELSVFPPSGIEEFVLPVKQGKQKVYWKINEIKTVADLLNEGKTMYNCVFSYKSRVQARAISIWSMTKNEDPVLTIEVKNYTREIVQARGTSNRPLTCNEYEILSMWAQNSSLMLRISPREINDAEI
jgi:hypothetical protein